MVASGSSAFVNSSLQDLICQLLILVATQSHQLQTVSGAGPVGVGIFSKKGSQLVLWDPRGKAWPCKGKVGKDAKSLLRVFLTRLFDAMVGGTLQACYSIKKGH